MLALCSTRLARTALVTVMVAATACNQRDPVPGRLEARLNSVTGPARPDSWRDEVEKAVARQLKSVSAPTDSENGPAGPRRPTRETLAAFYARRGNRLAWSDGSGRSLPAASLLLEALRRAGEHGLDPEDYALSRLDLLRTPIGNAPLDAAAIARLTDFDLLMTAAFFRYASDVSTGRVHPDEIRSDWHAALPELDPIAMLAGALEGGGLSELLDALPAPHVGYARLCRALQELLRVEAAGGWTAIPEGPKLARGSRGPRVSFLRQRLSEPAGDRFDGALEASVRRFQEAHGIEPDGKVGPTTLGELNVSVEQRARQVELNLERWRWLPRRLGDPHVVVNIPAFDLELVNGGASVWRTRIVVGSSFTPTPVFSDRIVAVVINPPWNVPKSIALGDYLPELRRDPKALQALGLRLLRGSEDDPRDVDPTTVDWPALAEGSFPYRLRQDPGPNNALGRVKFQLTNDFNVYLHDTPKRDVFGQSDRDLSHGCIRVQNPLDLARQLLDESSRDLLVEALDQTGERRVSVKPPVPIHIVYLTAWVDDAGDLRFSPDVYAFDEPQQRALARVASQAEEAGRSPVR